MSYIKKRQQEHINDELSLEEYDGKHVFVRLLKPDCKNDWEESLEEVNAIWKKKGWIVNKNQLDKLKIIMSSSNCDEDSNENNSEDSDCDDMDDCSERKGKRHKSSNEDSECDCSECEDESSSTDDELIQKALSRRLMSESTQKEIELETVEDSELEDVISVCRRFRFLYREIRHLKQRISELERRS